MRAKKRKKTPKKHYLFAPGPFSRRQVYFFVGFCALVFSLSVATASNAIKDTAGTVPDSFKSLPQERLEKIITEMTEGYPIAGMLPYIFKQDKLTAAYLVSIAKKESNWGKVSPRKDGEDCYNYWGFKGAGSRGKAAGHGCFGSPEEAVETVAKRIDTLTKEYELETPGQMVVWKCGSTCAGHSDASVKKWISDVAYYTKEIQEVNN